MFGVPCGPCAAQWHCFDAVRAAAGFVCVVLSSSDTVTVVGASARYSVQTYCGRLPWRLVSIVACLGSRRCKILDAKLEHRPFLEQLGSLATPTSVLNPNTHTLYATRLHTHL